jgi:succinate-semialdehyde dehydrogenase / glutarate-semialdehyde dehydrogenase
MTEFTGQLLIDGQWRPAADGGTRVVDDPATGQPIGTIAEATTADLDAALAAAARTAPEWAATSPWQRSAVLRRAAALLDERRSELAATLSAEQGKPAGEANGELTGAIEILDWCADEARRIYGRTIESRSADVRLLVTRGPVGPVAAFTASNFPALLPARKLGAALAAGCPVVLKPAEDTPFTALLIAQALLDAGLPAGVLGVLTGDPAVIAERLVASPVIAKISLTGSVPVGRTLLAQAAGRVIPSTMELGGHAAGLVFPDADVAATVDAVVAGKWRNCGQVCIALSRLYLHRDIHDEFVDRLLTQVATLRVGPAGDPASQVGPLLTERSRTRVEALLADATGRGAQVRAGGERPDGPGYFFPPTVLTGVPDDAKIWTDEPFGPVLPVTAFDTTAEAIERANSTEFGLSAFLFTRDLGTALHTADRLRAGMVGVNSLVIATAEAPAGGVGLSGWGREGGSEALDPYTTTKYVNLRLPGVSA